MCKVVLDKSVTDDELLDMLRGEVIRLKTQIKTNAVAASVPSSKSDTAYIDKSRDADASLQIEISRLQRLCKNQVRYINQRHI